MAGRGRGRGRGALAVAAETLGIGRGDLPPPTLEPPPVFPPLEFKPVLLLAGEEYDYMLALKQEYRGTIRDSPYFIKPQNRKKDIERYSDKYQTNGNQDSVIGFRPDWRRLPQELKIRSQRTKLRASIRPNLSTIDAKKSKSLSDDVIKKTLESLEQQETLKDTKGETVREEEQEEQEGEEGEEAEEEEFYDEEDLEEGTDYNVTYFDNGEDYGLDEDDNLDDGPIY
ncbi:DNA-directed RNA polymerase III subunit RPC7-like [Ptychodera flava]|uniref:DNA-directed RNA polymerase III subunit RPC7-like n=1 Tax=Ptychodera flava TaxID=63121 RepID=UPI00396A51CE